MPPTAHAKTVDAYLRTHESSLYEFIAEKRAIGLSYARVATALADFTEGIVDVTGETIRNWAAELDPDTAEVAS